MPDKTIQEAARELHLAVVAMRELIEREYPSRREVERRFISRESQEKRVAVAVVLIVLAAMVSFVMTVSTVSGCFLGEDDGRPGVCEILPGYDNHMARRERVEQEHENMRLRIAILESRLTRVEGR